MHKILIAIKVVDMSLLARVAAWASRRHPGADMAAAAVRGCTAVFP